MSNFSKFSQTQYTTEEAIIRLLKETGAQDFNEIRNSVFAFSSTFKAEDYSSSRLTAHTFAQLAKLIVEGKVIDLANGLFSLPN